MQLWSYWIGVWISFGAIVALCWKKNTKSTWPLVLTLVAFAGFTQIQDVTEISTRLFDFRFQRVQADIKQLQKITALLVQSIQDQDDYGGALGGVPAETRDRHKQAMLAILSEMDVDPAVVAEVKQRAHDDDVRDYAAGIENYVAFQLLKGDLQKGQAWQDAFHKLPGLPEVSPDDIQRLLSKFGVGDDFVQKLIRDYRFYLQNGTQRDPATWENRSHWPGNE